MCASTATGGSMHRTALLPLLLGLSLGAACDDSSTSPPTVATRPSPDADVNASRSLAINVARTPLSGGAMTVFNVSDEAFGQPAPNLGPRALALHDEGDEAFEAAFDAAVETERPGLGPVFDNISCEGCHLGDGRGRPPGPGEA